MGSDQSGRRLSTLTTATEIVEFVKNEGSVELANVMEEFDIAKSTAHGYLMTLEERELLVRGDGAYRLGQRLLHFGVHAKSRDDLFGLAESKVTELADQFGEGADFMVEENG